MLGVLPVDGRAGGDFGRSPSVGRAVGMPIPVAAASGFDGATASSPGPGPFERPAEVPAGFKPLKEMPLSAICRRHSLAGERERDAGCASIALSAGEFAGEPTPGPSPGSAAGSDRPPPVKKE
jgi:hypothetical protein